MAPFAAVARALDPMPAGLEKRFIAVEATGVISTRELVLGT